MKLIKIHQEPRGTQRENRYVLCYYLGRTLMDDNTIILISLETISLFKNMILIWSWILITRGLSALVERLYRHGMN